MTLTKVNGATWMTEQKQQSLTMLSGMPFCRMERGWLRGTFTNTKGSVSLDTWNSPQSKSSQKSHHTLIIMIQGNLCSMAIVLLVIFYAGLNVALGMLVFLFLLLFRMKEWSKLCVCVCVCVWFLLKQRCTLCHFKFSSWNSAFWRETDVHVLIQKKNISWCLIQWTNVCSEYIHADSIHSFRCKLIQLFIIFQNYFFLKYFSTQVFCILQSCKN